MGCLKASLVAKGCTQKYSLDYYDVFPLFVKIALLLLDSLFDYNAFLAPLSIGYIKIFFFLGDLEEEIYMEQPPCFVAQEVSSLVRRLHRYLYGLKQYP